MGSAEEVAEMGLLGRFKQMAKGAVKTLMVGGYRVMLPILPVQ